ncbi:protein of unknown function [Bradyrhizobium vignae]|uniref:Uncharacterized protein n=1 Tax=Bradyrhizobium vignae TaxID=1549949 RepID=A0A2U3Q6S9_9BRAD|nr:protein of unknown function [Bradyrhizobium vignae]
MYWIAPIVIDARFAGATNAESRFVELNLVLSHNYNDSDAKIENRVQKTKKEWEE